MSGQDARYALLKPRPTVECGDHCISNQRRQLWLSQLSPRCGRYIKPHKEKYASTICESSAPRHWRRTPSSGPLFFGCSVHLLHKTIPRSPTPASTPPPRGRCRLVLTRTEGRGHPGVRQTPLLVSFACSSQFCRLSTVLSRFQRQHLRRCL